MSAMVGRGLKVGFDERRADISKPYRGALSRRDFDGDFAEVSTAPDGLTLKGADRGFLHVPFERVVRMRVGFTESKSGLVYEAKAWLDGEHAPPAFFPYDRTDAHGYSGAMRALAVSLAESGKA